MPATNIGINARNNLTQPLLVKINFQWHANRNSWIQKTKFTSLKSIYLVISRNGKEKIQKKEATAKNLLQGVCHPCDSQNTLFYGKLLLLWGFFSRHLFFFEMFWKRCILCIIRHLNSNCTMLVLSYKIKLLYIILVKFSQLILSWKKRQMFNIDAQS